MIDTDISQVLPHFSHVLSANLRQGCGQENKSLDIVLFDGNIDEGCQGGCWIMQRFRGNQIDCRHALSLQGFVVKGILEGGGVIPVELGQWQVWSCSLTSAGSDDKLDLCILQGAGNG